MAIVRRKVIVPLNGNIDVNLSPFDRFAGRGGSVTVRATGVVATIDDLTLSLMIGSDIIADKYAMGAEAIVGKGPDKDTPHVFGVGAPADPITLNLQNANAGPLTVTVEAEIINA